MLRASTGSPESPFLLFSVAVTRVEAISPTYRRITFTGPDAARIADNRLDQRVKLLFPAPGHTLDEVPLGDDWYTQWRLQDNAERPIMRTYTIREVRAQAEGGPEFDIDFAVHGDIGPASRWALAAGPGDELIINAPNVAGPGPLGIDWHAPAAVRNLLLVGDETALPAIAGILEKLDPSDRGIAIVELPAAADAVALSDRPSGVEVRVLERGTDPVGTLLVDAVRAAAAELLDTAPAPTAAELEDVDIDSGLLWEVPVADDGGAVLDEAPLYAWLAGEAGVIKTLRRHLVSERGVDRRAVAFMGYWREGRAETN